MNWAISSAWAIFIHVVLGSGVTLVWSFASKRSFIRFAQNFMWWTGFGTQVRGRIWRTVYTSFVFSFYVAHILSLAALVDGV